MELITTPCSKDANSYATLEEFDAYLTGRDGFDPEGWLALTDDQKILRAMYGAAIIDSLIFRGRKAVQHQSLQFPRIMPDSKLYDSGKPFTDYESLEDFAALVDEPVPTVPNNVKLAQIESTFQIVHSHMLGIEAFENGEDSIASLSIDVISMTFRKEEGSAYNLFNKSDFGAASTIKLLLQGYLTVLRGELI